MPSGVCGLAANPAWHRNSTRDQRKIDLAWRGRGCIGEQDAAVGASAQPATFLGTAAAERGGPLEDASGIVAGEQHVLTPGAGQRATIGQDWCAVGVIAGDQ